MASSLEFINFICEQLESCGMASYKKMFGEYMIYVNAKPIILVCDDTAFVKINNTAATILGENAEQGYPYDGAKIHFVVTDVDDKELMVKLAMELEKITPLPKRKKTN